MSVSYTHLDVYKRQIYICTKFRKKNDVYCLLVRCRTFGLCIYPVRQLKYIICLLYTSLFSVVVLFLCAGILNPKEMLEGFSNKGMITAVSYTHLCLCSVFFNFISGLKVQGLINVPVLSVWKVTAWHWKN